MTNENSQYVDINDILNPPSKTPSELYDELCNLQQLVTYLSDEQLDQTIEWCTVANSDDDEDLINLLQVCIAEQQEREAHDKWLTKDQVADMLGNDSAHYVWDGDDLYYLAHPDQHDDNY